MLKARILKHLMINKPLNNRQQKRNNTKYIKLD